MAGNTNSSNEQETAQPLRVLICPLDWGIGHATRCIPLIEHFRNRGCRVMIAGTGRSVEVLKREYPELTYVDLPGTEIRYASGKLQIIRLIRLVPSFLWSIRNEKRAMRRIVKSFSIRMIISDNRFGCRHPDVLSVFLTHQLVIMLPRYLRWLEGTARRINYCFIRRFDECWIPDFEVRNGIAGRLSHPGRLPSNARYVGILSRFLPLISPVTDSHIPSIDILALISGPEPQRTIFEEILTAQLKKLELVSVVVGGNPDHDVSESITDNLHRFSYLTSERLLELLARSSLVICRSGYSTIMDLMTVGKKAVLVPTPGQTEQEYLAAYLMDKKIYLSMNQDDFNIFFALEISRNFPGMVIRNNEADLEERISFLISKVQQRVTGSGR